MATDAKSGASAGDLNAVSADIYMGEEICMFSNTSNPTFRSLHISDGAHGQPFGCFECYQFYAVFLKMQRWPYHFCEILSNRQNICRPFLVQKCEPMVHLKIILDSLT